MQFSDFSKSSDSSGSREARASMGRLLSYWQYYRRKIHLPWRALFICDHRGFTIHLSSNHHHHHHIIVTLSSRHHHYHQIIIILSLHHHPQLVKIISLSSSAGNHYISWKGSLSRKEKKKNVWLWVKVNLQYALLLHNRKIAWVSWPLCTRCTGGSTVCIERCIHCVHNVHFYLCYLGLDVQRPLDNQRLSTIQRLIKSTCGVYCNTMFHVAGAKIIRHINMVLHVETLAHFSVPKRKSVGKKWSIG